MLTNACLVRRVQIFASVGLKHEAAEFPMTHLIELSKPDVADSWKLDGEVFRIDSKGEP